MKKILSIILVTFVIVPLLMAPAEGATDEQMELSGAAAVAYLASVQNPDGSWGQYGDFEAKTGLVLLKFLARAQELSEGLPPPPIDPFDNDPLSPSYYEYADNVIAGFDYLLSHAYEVPISLQTHGDPDTNGNGMGIVFSGLQVYSTGIALTALATSGHPDDRSAVIGTLGLLTYREIAQDVVDWLCFAQGDMGDARGGFNYDALDNSGYRTDNSNGGYAYLGLAFAEDAPFSCMVPQWVRDELNLYIDWIQNDVNGDPDDGGSGYDHPDNMVNVLKTGNLIFEMAFYGDTPSTPRVQDAVAYLERHWRDPNNSPGWGYSLPVADYQAKFLIEKGLTYMGIDELDTNGDTIKENWFNQEPSASPPEDFATVIVSQQLPSGAWPNCQWDEDPDAILSTAWAVLTLERFAPPSEAIPVPVDIKPQSWPNPLQLKQRGVLPVAICGTAEFDVTTIDPETVQLTLEGLDVGVPPLRWSYEDVATPYTGEPYGGHDLGPDGYLDLTLKFKTQEVIATLDLDVFSDGDVIILMLTGNLKEEFDGTRILGQDYVWILHK